MASISLEEAREQRGAFRKLLKEGIDPATQKDQPHAASYSKDGAATFKDMALEFVNNQQNI